MPCNVSVNQHGYFTMCVAVRVYDLVCHVSLFRHDIRPIQLYYGTKCVYIRSWILLKTMTTHSWLLSYISYILSYFFSNSACINGVNKKNIIITIIFLKTWMSRKDGFIIFLWFQFKNDGSKCIFSLIFFIFEFIVLPSKYDIAVLLCSCRWQEYMHV